MSTKDSVFVREQMYQVLPFGDTIQKRAFTGTSAQSSAFQNNTTILRLCATEDCYYTVGSNPTASDTAGQLLPASVVEYILVEGGQKIAAVQVSTGGDLNIAEFAVGS